MAKGVDQRLTPKSKYVMRYHEIMTESVDPASSHFRRWFGASKVVDEQGKPLLCYHGTYAGFETFKPLSHFGSLKVATELATAWANQTGHVRPIYLRIEHPLEVDDSGLESGAQFEEWCRVLLQKGIMTQAEHTAVYQDRERPNQHKVLIAALRTHGFDGLTYLNTQEDVGNLSRSWVITSPDQVWHAMLDNPD
jgi:hypothetical protein